MIINNIDVYRDGGTVKVETNEGIFYIDRRIRTETKDCELPTHANAMGGILTNK